MIPAGIGPLWDLMTFFLVADLLTAISVLTSVETQCAFLSESARQNAKPCPCLPNDTHKNTVAYVKKAFSYCGLGHIPEKIQLSLLQLEAAQVMDASGVEAELRNIRELVLMECSRHRFLRVDPDRSAYLDQPSLLGDEVRQAFPSAIPDIREAGNCMAAECNTAAVFHLMRTVEWGLRALCANLGIKRVKSKIKKSGRVVYAPIEYAEWERLLDQFQDQVDSKIQRLKRGSNKQDLQQFYYPALQDIRGIRDAWRNHVMHTRDEYTREDASAILSHVKRLMSTLATRVTEV
jgi:hypothetical protein